MEHPHGEDGIRGRRNVNHDPTSLLRTRDLLQGAAWVINLAVAEWLLRRRPARRRLALSTAGALS